MVQDWAFFFNGLSAIWVLGVCSAPLSVFLLDCFLSLNFRSVFVGYNARILQMLSPIWAVLSFLLQCLSWSRKCNITCFFRNYTSGVAVTGPRPSVLLLFCLQEVLHLGLWSTSNERWKLQGLGVDVLDLAGVGALPPPRVLVLELRSSWETGAFTHWGILWVL